MASVSKDDVVFDPRTLRLIVGALAFAFPSTVVLLTQAKAITSSISSSYYDDGNRDVFVGFLFIIGALLIAYEGHLQGRAKRKSETVWHWILSFKWVKVYQEKTISTVGGLAAIFTALYPINRDHHLIDTSARIHTICASILFSAVIYFSMVAFPRRVNRKLARANPVFRKIAYAINRIQRQRKVDSIREFIYRWFPTLSTFFSILKQASTSYNENDSGQIALALPDHKNKPNKLTYLWLAYGKKLARGIVYVICGFVIIVTLATFVYLAKTIDPNMVIDLKITFIVETIALVAFGIAWMTASQLEYLKQIQSWWKATFEKTNTAPKQTLPDVKPGAAE